MKQAAVRVKIYEDRYYWETVCDCQTWKKLFFNNPSEYPLLYKVLLIQMYRNFWVGECEKCHRIYWGTL